MRVQWVVAKIWWRYEDFLADYGLVSVEVEDGAGDDGRSQIRAWAIQELLRGDIIDVQAAPLDFTIQFI